MKKQLMTLAVCFALTASATFAATSAKVTMKATVPVAAKTQTLNAKPCPPPATEKQKFEEKMAKDREELYCKLGLSQEQRDKADALHKCSRESAEPLFAKYHEEKAKLHELKAQKACPCKIEEQRLKVKVAKHAVKEHMAKYRKDFESILTKDQLCKFNQLRKEQKEEWKKAKCHCKGKCKCHHHHHMFMFDEGDFHFPGCPKKEEPKPACPCETK